MPVTNTEPPKISVIPRRSFTATHAQRFALREASVLAVFLVLSGMALAPLLRSPSTVLPDLGDSLHNMWIYAGNIIRLGHGRFLDFFDAGILFPQRYTLAFGEFQPLNTIVFGLFWGLTGSSAAAYNLLLYFSFVVTGYSTYLLGRQLEADAPLALFAGVAVALFPYRFAHLPHSQILSLQWALLPLVFFLMYLRSGARSLLAAFGVLLFLQMSSIGYTTFYLFIGFGSVLAASWLARTDGETRPRLLRVAAVVGATAVLIIPFYLPYLSLAVEGTKRGMTEFLAYGVDLALLTATPPENTAYGVMTAPLRDFREDGSISGVFPGFGVLLLWTLAVTRVVANWRRAGGEPNLTDTRSARLLPRALVGAGFLLALLALGPVIKLRGASVMLSPAYLLFQYVPLFSAFRYLPNHMHAAFSFLTIGAAVGVSAFRWGLPSRSVLLAFLSALGLLEFRTTIGTVTAPLILEAPQSVYTWLRSQARGPVLELPAPGLGHPNGLIEFQYQLASLVHEFPIANGVSGFRPHRTEELFLAARSFPSLGALRAIERTGIKYVVVHKDLSADLGERARAAATDGRLTLLYEDDSASVFGPLPAAMANTEDLMSPIGDDGAKAGFELVSCGRAAPGSSASVVVSVKNNGTKPWRASTAGLTEPAGSGEVRIGVRHWTKVDDGAVPIDSTGTPLNGRGRLEDDVLPGDAKQLRFEIPAPTTPGRYRVKFGLVQELVAWFPLKDRECEIEVR